MAKQIGLPIAALTGEQDVRLIAAKFSCEIQSQPFATLPAEKNCFSGVIAAKLAIADEIAIPLARLSTQDRQFIDKLLDETLERAIVLARIRGHFRKKARGGSEHAG